VLCLGDRLRRLFDLLRGGDGSRDRASLGSQSRQHLFLDVLIDIGGADRRPRVAEALGVAADAVVDRVALSRLLDRVACDLERVVAAGAADQPAE
jgi:hypothetical protein